MTCDSECYRRAAVARFRPSQSHHFTTFMQHSQQSRNPVTERRLPFQGLWTWPPHDGVPSRKHVTYQDPAIAPPAALSLRRRPRPCGRLCFLLGAAAACARPKLGRPPNSEAPVISVTCALRTLCINVLLSLPPSLPTQLEPWMAPGWAQCTRIICSMGDSNPRSGREGLETGGGHGSGGQPEGAIPPPATLAEPSKRPGCNAAS